MQFPHGVGYKREIHLGVKSMELVHYDCLYSGGRQLKRGREVSNATLSTVILITAESTFTYIIC